jgi:O-antigen ligase
MTGSRAGTSLIVVGLAAGLAILGLARQAERGRILPVAIIGAGALALLLGVIVLTFSGGTAIERVLDRFSNLQDTRGNVWADTWFALTQYWPAGFGLGGFEPAMLAAERLEFVDPSVPNRAHNDYLEIGLEAGLLGYLAVVASTIVIVAMFWRSWRAVQAMHSQLVFGAAVLLLIALHSVVDYPLRSMAIACLVGLASGMLARTPESVR